MNYSHEMQDYLYRWSHYVLHVDLIAVLNDNGYKSIAIYGGGVMGWLFYETIVGSGIHVECIIDRNDTLDFPFQAPVVRVQEFLELDKKVDVVFIASFDKNAIYRQLLPKVKSDIIYLPDFIISEESFSVYQQIISVLLLPRINNVQITRHKQ